MTMDLIDVIVTIVLAWVLWMCTSACVDAFRGDKDFVTFGRIARYTWSVVFAVLGVATACAAIYLVVIYPAPLDW